MIDTDELATWMDEKGLGVGEPIESELVAGGTQNEIYGIRRGEVHGALRIPPDTAPETRDAGILREWRIIEALDGTDVPHTRAIAVCEDQSVLGRTFYLMGFVDGWSPMNTDGWPAPFDTDVAARAGLAFELVDGIALLSKVDWQAKGLQDLGRPDGFHERQVDRWTTFLERIKGRDAARLRRRQPAWLREHKPLDFTPGLMHGDYQFANVMYEHGAPARLAAIVDWEMGTVGDPKLDLAWVVNSWPEDPDAGEAGISYVDMKGMPGRTAVLDRYSEVFRPSGRRHRLLLRARQVEARRGARAGVPTGRRQHHRCRPSVRWCSTSWPAPPSWPSRATTAREPGGGPVATVGVVSTARGSVRPVRSLTCAPPSVPCTAAPAWCASTSCRHRCRGTASCASECTPPPSTSPTCSSWRTSTRSRCRRPSCRAASWRESWTRSAPGCTAWRSATASSGPAMVGAFAQEVVLPTGSVQPVPDGIDLRDAAAFGVAHRTAYHVLRSVCCGAARRGARRARRTVAGWAWPRSSSGPPGRLGHGGGVVGGQARGGRVVRRDPPRRSPGRGPAGGAPRAPAGWQ